MWLTERQTFTVLPPPSAYPMTSSPPLPVSHDGELQHSSALSMVAWSGFWSARAIAASTMFQLSSGDGSTGPSAFSINAGSAAEGSSPYSASGLSATTEADSSAVADSAGAAVVAAGAAVVAAGAAV